MRFMLDTNACIHLIKRRPPSVMAAFRRYSPDDFCVSSITYAELCRGVSKSKRREYNRLALTLLLAEIRILPFDASAAIRYGDLRAAPEAAGMPIGIMDQLIAAHALSRDLTLVTHNTKEFSRVPGLRWEDWA